MYLTMIVHKFNHIRKLFTGSLSEAQCFRLHLYITIYLQTLPYIFVPCMYPFMDVGLAIERSEMQNADTRIQEIGADNLQSESFTFNREH